MTKLALVALAALILCHISFGQRSNENELEFDNADNQLYTAQDGDGGRRLTGSNHRNSQFGTSNKKKVNTQCYSCTGCPYVDASTPKSYCRRSTDPDTENSCVVFVEKYKHMDEPWVIRGCASERGSCEEIKGVHEGTSDIVRLEGCAQCYGDNCNVNAAEQSMADIALTVMTLILSPLLLKSSVS